MASSIAGALAVATCFSPASNFPLLRCSVATVPEKSLWNLTVTSDLPPALNHGSEARRTRIQAIAVIYMYDVPGPELLDFSPNNNIGIIKETEGLSFYYLLRLIHRQLELHGRHVITSRPLMFRGSLLTHQPYGEISSASVGLGLGLGLGTMNRHNPCLRGTNLHFSTLPRVLSSASIYLGF
ncbi:hypothetical protein K402DRAFT_75664 [Aulographum hederae CBS 113979]|uniref:Uncharacterized protein n=1 Tax=Aulographum hederae CBS 113979 TaxID=1176131 RepID=A0A6G1HFW1_9PEZI|nr:hypothetical protein K402DRAFT_75664 [Aulographum hederae CBS 113979]